MVAENDNEFFREVSVMPFGMEKEEIESKVVEELRKRPGHVARFNNYQIEAISQAIASVIAENNTKTQYSLEGKMGNERTWVEEMLNTMASLTGQSVDTLREKAVLAGIGLRLSEPMGEKPQVFGRLDDLVYTNGSERYRHAFTEPKPLLIKLQDESLFLLRDESKYSVARNSGGKWELTR